jgi:predicted alpha/beta-hydrolase family hydrolase
MPHFLYLGGDSYPGDAHCEEQVISELTHRLGLTFTRQSEMMPADPEEQKNWLVLSSRYEQIQNRLEALSDKETIILIGRSSGSRVATSFAYRNSTRSNPISTKPISNNIAAMICFAYPFRAPHQKIDPSRFAHLADITIPTLIIQGTRDEYGAAEVIDNYALSPSVEMLLVDGDHGVNLSAEDWEKTFQHITQFLTKAVHQYKTKRAQTLSRNSQKVFNRCVYYFGDGGSGQAKHHYASYLTHAHTHPHAHNQKKSNLAAITPLQWQPDQTFWDIQTRTPEGDNPLIVTLTNYHFVEWSDMAHSFGMKKPAHQRQSIQRFTEGITDFFKSIIFKDNKKHSDSEQERQEKRFIARLIVGQESEQDNRIAQQATELISRMQTQADQEILLIGEGVGSVLAAKSLMQAYEIYPALFEQKTKINLLTVNLKSLLSNQVTEADKGDADKVDAVNVEAAKFRNAFDKLKQTEDLQHVDVDLHPQSDITSFALPKNINALNANSNFNNDSDSDNDSDISEDTEYNYLDITAGSERFSKIFSLKTLPEIPDDFDPADYLALNPDVAQRGLEPIWHWQHHGAREKRPYQTKLPLGFDADTYLNLNPDVAASGMDAAQHYILHGFEENRRFY